FPTGRGRSSEHPVNRGFPFLGYAGGRKRRSRFLLAEPQRSALARASSHHLYHPGSTGTLCHCKDWKTGRKKLLKKPAKGCNNFCPFPIHYSVNRKEATQYVQ